MRRAVQMALEIEHACFRMDNGAVVCRGTTEDGAIGAGDPLDLGTARTALGVATSWLGGCALTDDHQVRCWGRYNGLGHYAALLDNRDTVDEMGDSILTADLKSSFGAIAIAGGDATSHYCVILENHTVSCWGGENGPDMRVAEDAVAIDMGIDFGCVLKQDESVDCIFARADSEHYPGPYAAIAIGQHHGCLLSKAGEVSCWGDNDYGQLGLGDTVRRTTPEKVNLGTNRKAVKIDSKGGTTCALLDNGQIKCWGVDAGHLGNPLGFGIGPCDSSCMGDSPNETGDSIPALDVGSDEIVDIAVGASMTGMPENDYRPTVCVLTSEGRVKCWGYAPYAWKIANGMGDKIPYLDLGAADLPKGCGCDKEDCYVASQAEVDALSHCEEIRRLSISSTGVTDLRPLSKLRRIGGPLRIEGSGLTTLEGLDNVRRIHGDVDITANTALTSLTGLDSLERIRRNPIDYTNASLAVYDNPLISDMTGLSSLASVEGELMILRNGSLKTLTGLRSMVITDMVTISGNPQLTSIEPLRNSKTNSIIIGHAIRITDNASLPMCHAIEVAAWLRSDSQQTANVCNNLAEAACATCTTVK